MSTNFVRCKDGADAIMLNVVRHQSNKNRFPSCPNISFTALSVTLSRSLSKISIAPSSWCGIIEAYKQTKNWRQLKRNKQSSGDKRNCQRLIARYCNDSFLLCDTDYTLPTNKTPNLHCVLRYDTCIVTERADLNSLLPCKKWKYVRSVKISCSRLLTDKSTTLKT